MVQPLTRMEKYSINTCRYRPARILFSKQADKISRGHCCCEVFECVATDTDRAINGVVELFECLGNGVPDHHPNKAAQDVYRRRALAKASFFK
jgi:hypothetical protein